MEAKKIDAGWSYIVIDDATTIHFDEQLKRFQSDLEDRMLDAFRDAKHARLSAHPDDRWDTTDEEEFWLDKETLADIAETYMDPEEVE